MPKLADPSVYPAIAPTDDDQLLFRTAAGGDGRAALVQPKGYIDGLRMTWLSGTQIQISTGAAYVPGAKRIAELAAPVTLTPSLAANTWYHVYLTVSGAVTGAEAVTTVPAAVYSGTARTKTGDTSRRYIGSFRVGSAATILRFVVSGNLQCYDLPAGSVDMRLSLGTATTATPFSIASVVPVTATMIRVFLTSGVGSGSLFVGNPLNAAYVAIFGGNVSAFDIPLDPTDLRLFYRMTTSAGSGGIVDANGFYIER